MASDLFGRFVRATDDEDPEAYGALYREAAVMREPLLSEPARGRDAIVAEVTLRATLNEPLDVGEGEPLPPSGARIEVPSVWMLELDHAGLNAEERDYFDTARMMQQLGLPSAAVERTAALARP